MKKKILVLCVVLALAATTIIGGTLAYFTDTDNKTNTFTVGKVDITLTEPEWDEEQAKLMPSRVIPKDPTITVTNDSERAYTFMKVQLSEDFRELITSYYTNTGSDSQNMFTDWFTTEVGPKIMKADLDEGYVILGVLSPKNPGESVTYFDEVKIPADVEASMIKVDGVYEIEITAYAIQAEGFEGEGVAPQEARQAAYNALFPPVSN